MKPSRALFVQTRYALVSSLRNPRVVVFGLAFPVALLVLFSSIFTSGANKTTRFAGGSIDAKAYFTAGLVAYAIMLQTFTQLVTTVSAQRESGQLKRLRGTPMPAWTFVAANVLRSVLLVVLMVIVLLTVGAVAFGVSVPASAIGPIALFSALGTAALATLGIAVTVLTTTAESASSVGPFFAVMLSFVSGVFIPVSQLPHWLADVGRAFPLAPLADGLQRALLPHGGGVVGSDVLVIAAWGAGALIFAARRFKWEPQGSRT